MKYMLKKISYEHYKWLIFVDLDMMIFCWGIFIKYSCSLIFKNIFWQKKARNCAIKIHYLFSLVSWAPEINKQCAWGEFSSVHKRVWNQVLGTLRFSRDDWLLLTFEERHSCFWGFKGLEETIICALNFIQWQSNIIFTCINLYQYLLFNFQNLEYVKFY